jgi:anthranilate phosphoribosyltransferase
VLNTAAVLWAAARVIDLPAARAAAEAAIDSGAATSLLDSLATAT